MQSDKDVEADVISGRTWEEFCDTLKRAGQQIRTDVHNAAVQVDQFAHRVGDKVHDAAVHFGEDVKRTAGQIDQDVHRAADCVAEWAQRTGEKIDEEAHRVCRKIDETAHKVGSEIHAAAVKVGAEVKDFVDAAGQRIHAAAVKADQDIKVVAGKIDRDVHIAAAQVDQFAHRVGDKIHDDAVIAGQKIKEVAGKVDRDIHAALHRAKDSTARVATTLALPSVCGAYFMSLYGQNSKDKLKTLLGTKDGLSTVAMFLGGLPLLFVALPFAALSWTFDKLDHVEDLFPSKEQMAEFGRRVDHDVHQAMSDARAAAESIKEKVERTGAAFRAKFLQVVKKVSDDMHLEKVRAWVEKKELEGLLADVAVLVDATVEQELQAAE